MFQSVIFPFLPLGCYFALFIRQPARHKQSDPSWFSCRSRDLSLEDFEVERPDL